MNFSDMDSKHFTKCITQVIFVFALKDIFVMTFKHNTLYGKLDLYFQTDNGKLAVHLHILSL